MKIKESIVVPIALWMKAVAEVLEINWNKTENLSALLWLVWVFVLTRLPFNLFLAQVASQEG
jgi:hypothetical protein